MQPEPSIFTRIINGEIPCHRLYEDEKLIAFLDIHPLTEGHTLVIPKTQIDHLWDLDGETYEYLWKHARTLAESLKEALEPARVGVIVEGFGVPHAHIHLVPINHPEELKQTQDLDSEPDHENLAAVAEKIREYVRND
jgi:histidine triad (HIT) family protein